MKKEQIVGEAYRGLWYEDGAFVKVLSPGRYEIPESGLALFGKRKAAVRVELVDIRERELTIKGQEILTSDKVAIRVSIIVLFQVTDPVAAKHRVQDYEERIYSEVQLAARRSLASMTLEEILTNRNRLSEDILRDVKESASSFGIAVLRADVKDLAFPGNLQEVMNRVLAAERLAQAQLVEARTKAEVQRIEAETKVAARRAEMEMELEVVHNQAKVKAEADRLRSEAEVQDLLAKEKIAALLAAHPQLLRLRELEALSDLAKNAAARIHIGFQKHFDVGDADRL